MDHALRATGLVRQAINLAVTVSNCLYWENDAVQIRVRNDANLQGLTPREIRRLTCEHVGANGVVYRREEDRPQWRGEHEYLFWVLIPVEGLPKDLYVELRLISDDDDFPEVAIVNAHLTSF